ncbi:hypothetical protein LZ554_006861 [Drepanopeziza brunnea f. sp. 'monogermtubi']|nr:hypothetical protein LZ554_006861 [Drepanopeziza brunnea f. sp. 'monogermtubi']
MAPLDQIQQGPLGVLQERRDSPARSHFKILNMRSDDDFGGKQRLDTNGNMVPQPLVMPGINVDGKKFPLLATPAAASSVIVTRTMYAPVIAASPIDSVAPTTIVVTTTAPPITSTIWMTTSIPFTPSISTTSTISSSSSSPSSSPSSSTELPYMAAAAANITATSTTFSPSSTITPVSILPAWTERPELGRPRKGLDEPDQDRPASTPHILMTATSTVVTSATVAVASATMSALPGQDDVPRQQEKPGTLSSSATHWLIALAAIGAFVTFSALVMFLCLKMKGRRFYFGISTKHRKFGKGGPRGWYGWRKENDGYTDYPPQYYAAYSADEKSSPTQRQVEAYYSTSGSPYPMPNSGSAATPLGKNSQPLEQFQPGLVVNSNPFVNPQYPQTSSPIEQAASTLATQDFYGVGGQNNINQGQEPSSAYSNSVSPSAAGGNVFSDYSNTGNNNVMLSRQPGSQNTLTTSGAYDPSQREVNHMSYLSSLSSGFGDGLIMPEPTVNGGASRQTYRQSRNPETAAARLSWATSVPEAPALKGDRDTMYTTTSQDSLPRFRTVNSWVAQQTDHVDRQQQSGREIPPMPPIPHSLRTNVGVGHNRMLSEDTAFRYHPGSRVLSDRGSRVPSSILDTKTFIARDY